MSKKLNSVELRDRQEVCMNRCKEIVEACKAEVREMTEDEEKEFNDLKQEIVELKEQYNEIQKSLESYDEELEEQKACDDEDENEKRKFNKNKMDKNFSIVKEIRSAIEDGTNKFNVNAATEMRAMTVTGGEGLHDNVVETEIQGILEPLYAESVLAKLGVKFYKGLPMGDISVPVMGKNSVGWAGEVAAASSTGNTFTNVTLQPKRLTAYVDISKMLLAQDTIGVEEAVRRDIVNAISDKLEATILDSSAATTTRPGGIFYLDASSNYVDCSTFGAICEMESTLEDANVYGDLKYLLSPGAKADLRQMAKSALTNALVMENGEVDGTPAITTSNVKTAGLLAYGDWSNLAVGSWGDIEIVVDPYTQAVNGCTRLIVNAYFDAKILRDDAFAFGATRTIA